MIVALELASKLDELGLSLISFLAGVGARDIWYNIKTRQEAKSNRGDESEHLE